jgi:hypothetical protein
MNCVGLFISFIFNCLPKKNQTLGESIQYALHLFLCGCVLVIITQQITLTIDTYYTTVQEYRNAVKLYADEDCATYRGSSRARLQECSELNTIIRSSVYARTLIRVTQGWNSCIYLSCSDLLTAVSNHLQYKIALVLISMAIISYSMKIFRCTKKRSKDYLIKKTIDMNRINEKKNHHLLLEQLINNYERNLSSQIINK